jgi:hypothetical protein
LSRAAEHEAELWAYAEKGEAAASGAEQQRVTPISRIGWHYRFVEGGGLR